MTKRTRNDTFMKVQKSMSLSSCCTAIRCCDLTFQAGTLGAAVLSTKGCLSARLYQISVRSGTWVAYYLHDNNAKERRR